MGAPHRPPRAGNHTIMRGVQASAGSGQGQDQPPATVGGQGSGREIVLSPPSLTALARTGAAGEPATIAQIILQLPIKRVAIWVAFACLVWCIKDFTGLIIGTFILSYLGNSVVEWAQRRWPDTYVHKRSALVSAYFLLIIVVLVGFGILTLPSLVREASDFISRLENEDIYVVVSQKMRLGLGEPLCNALERFLTTSSDVAESASIAAAGAAQEVTKSGFFSKATIPIPAPIPTPVLTGGRLGSALHKTLSPYTGTAITVTTGLITTLTKISVNVLISMVLSFMVVSDLPTLRRGMESLKSSRISPFFNEIAPPVVAFGRLFGKALQAQMRIAFANTVLTCAGICALQLPGAAILTLFVFLCSFIPVAGVALSTFPMGFVALTEYGFFKLALVVAMVVGIHFVEAYMLNPMIYSNHLKLHPLLVLGSLVVC